MRRPAAALPFLLCCALAAPADLSIQVLRGNGTNNNAVSGASVAPSVRILNSAGGPVAGAQVVFTAPSSGPSVEFSGYGRIAQVLSDETGAATAPQLRPSGADGPVEIRITASKDGSSATAAISEMNLGMERAESSDALDVVVVSHVSGPRRQIVFQVQTAQRKPVPGAAVQMTMQVLNSAGKLSGDIRQSEGVSGPDGQIAFSFGNAPRDRLQITIRAGLGGRYATRYFEF